MRLHPEVATVPSIPTRSARVRFTDPVHAVSRTLVPDEEGALIDRAVRGDRGAARAIYDAHVGAVHRLASRMLGPDMADECTQDAFVRAFQRLATFRREAALRTWLHTITVSVALNHKRSQRRAAAHISLDVAPDVACSEAEGDPLLQRRIGAAIDGLSAELRAVVVLSLIEGHTHPEIAEILGIPEGTSKARLSRARSQLRHALADIAPLNN